LIALIVCLHLVLLYYRLAEIYRHLTVGRFLLSRSWVICREETD
jgi:hypothetical protein